MRVVCATTVLAALAALMPLPAAAESHEGIVRQIRIDSDTDAPLCVATSPGMPGGAWACIYPNRRHYHEMKEMLFRALDARHTCSFVWTNRDAITNRAQLVSVACSSS
jgi:hypothetical protein